MSGPSHSMLKPLRSHSMLTLTLYLTLTCFLTSAKKSVSATANTALCSYTVVVDEFDLSKCPAATEPAQADSNGMDYGVPGIPKARGANKLIRTATHTIEAEDVPSDPTLMNQVKDMETKLLDEMVRSREFNSTLSRHEVLLLSAQQSLDAYKANFSSIFRVMMMMERKLKNQRRVNRSLNKKLSNVILDIVEINNVMTRKLPTGDAAKKQFAVESGTGFRACPGFTKETKQYKDCGEVYRAGHHSSDVYFIKPIYSACPIPVWCDMDSPGAGWLVFQRRRDGSVNFNRKWDEYRHGFGDVSGEHWLGNDNLFLLTNQDKYQLRIDLWDFEGNRVFAVYNNFKIDGERDGYQLTISGYSGSAKDALVRHNGKKFSTMDRDNDSRRDASCAQEWEAGWWFDNCWFALLNGPYHNSSDVSWRGLAWNHWKREQLRAAEMKLKPIYR